LASSALAEGNQVGAFRPLFLPGRVVTIACLHQQSGPLDRQSYFAIAGTRSIRRVTDTILVAQLFFQLHIDCRDWLGARDFQEAASGFASDALQRLLAVQAGVNAVVGIAIGKQDGIDQRVGSRATTLDPATVLPLDRSESRTRGLCRGGELGSGNEGWTCALRPGRGVG